MWAQNLKYFFLINRQKLTKNINLELQEHTHYITRLQLQFDLCIIRMSVAAIIANKSNLYFKMSKCANKQKQL